LLTALFIPAIFTYLFFKGNEITHKGWLLCFLFLFAEINLLFIDFGLWDYYKGKRVFRIWMIEATTISVTACFFI